MSLASSMPALRDDVMGIHSTTSPVSAVALASQRDLGVIAACGAEGGDAPVMPNEGVLSAQREFLAVISHEFRTPLASLESTHFLLRQRLADHEDPRVTRYLEVQAECLGVLRDLVQHVLMVNRLQAGTHAPAKRRLKAASLLRDMADRINASEPTARVVFSARSECEVEVDEHLFRAAVDNLLSNAMKFSDRSQRVDLTCARVEQTLEIAVLDRGRGIPAADQSRVFSPFARGANVGSVPGTGLGLAIVRQAMESLGGSVEFDSVEGVGTRFVLRFPAAPGTGALCAA